jgi:hypothetical protein
VIFLSIRRGPGSRVGQIGLELGPHQQAASLSLRLIDLAFCCLKRASNQDRRMDPSFELVGWLTFAEPFILPPAFMRDINGDPTLAPFRAFD